MVKIINHPASDAIIEKHLEKMLNSDKISVPPFMYCKRDGGIFDKFMDKADTLLFSQEAIEQEAKVFNNELIKNSKLVFQFQKLSKVPANAEEIQEYKKLSSEVLKIAKNCGAVNIAENMKIAFNLMLEMAKNKSTLNTKI